MNSIESIESESIDLIESNNLIDSIDSIDYKTPNANSETYLETQSN